MTGPYFTQRNGSCAVCARLVGHHPDCPQREIAGFTAGMADLKRRRAAVLKREQGPWWSPAAVIARARGRALDRAIDRLEALAGGKPE